MVPSIKPEATLVEVASVFKLFQSLLLNGVRVKHLITHPTTEVNF